MSKSRQLLSTANGWMALLFILFCGFIIFQSIHDESGFVTSDSAHYLQLAQNILDGNGLSTANYVEGMSTYFATWPIGYPASIAIISLVTGASVFWASKIFNMICLLFCFVLLKRLFGDRAPLAALFFSISTVASMFVYTWSEVPFLLGMLWLVFGLHRYMETEKKQYIVHMIVAALLLFLSRYIGLIGAGSIGLTGFIYLFRKQWRQMWTCWLAGGSVIVFAGLYLLNNLYQTGLTTGMERIPRTETANEFIIMVKESLLTEVNIFTNELNHSLFGFMLILFIALLLFIRPKQAVALFRIKRRAWRLPAFFLSISVVYLAAIIYMRWTAYFDSFTFRLIGPATFMFGLSIISWVIQLEGNDWRRWRNAIGIVLCAALLFNLGYGSWQISRSERPAYAETIKQVHQMYEQIPAGSIVAFENFHARYLRTDIQFIKVHFKPYFADAESVQSFKKRITPNEAAGVYIQQKPLVGYTYGDGFPELMKQAEKQKKHFIKIE